MAPRKIMPFTALHVHQVIGAASIALWALGCVFDSRGGFVHGTSTSITSGVEDGGTGRDESHGDGQVTLAEVGPNMSAETTLAETTPAETMDPSVGDAGETTSDTSAGTAPGTSTTADSTGETRQDAPRHDRYRCDGAADLGPGAHMRTLIHGGRERSYRVLVPATYQPTDPTPLVVNLHDFGASGVQQELLSAMTPTAEAKGFIVAYPEGVQGSWHAGTCCGAALAQNVDDVGFMRALVDDLSSTLCIDPKRVFAAGFSNGGALAHRLACEASDVFAAVASIAGGLLAPTCTPSRATSVLAFHGLQDSLVPYQTSLDAISKWLMLDDCSSSSTRMDYGTSYCDRYMGCDAGAEIMFCTLNPMGHCWPGGSMALCLLYSDDIEANALIWEFFSEHALP